MLPTLPHLQSGTFPSLRRQALTALQVNLGYRCNQSCLHCHVGAGPNRREQMSAETVAQVIAFLETGAVTTLDITGGAPELNPHFRHLVTAAHRLGLQVIDRCNLTILAEPGQEDLADFLAAHGVEITASLPCYQEENVDGQRGKGVFHTSIDALRKLNALGYGRTGSGLVLNLVYNPTGAFLPPAQQALENDYRRELGQRYGIEFNHLYTLANLPIQRFGSTLLSQGKFQDYLDLLRDAFRTENLDSVMCRSLVSIDWRGFAYDCDFNQMLDLPLQLPGKTRVSIGDLIGVDLTGRPIAVADHCYGCTAGQGSSCGGALS